MLKQIQGIHHVTSLASSPTANNRFFTEALGLRAVGRIEVLGKARFLRATTRWSDATRTVMAGLLGFLGSLAALAASALQGAGLRFLRRFVR